jgi:hypothetical protein
MNVVRSESLLAELGASITSLQVDVGTRGRRPHDYAYLRLKSPLNPDDWAELSTPGDRWFTLEVAGGFADNDFSEFNDDQEVRRILDAYLHAAISYLEGRRTVGKSRLFRTPFVVVETDDGPLKLQLSVNAEFKYVFRRRQPGDSRG